MTTVDSSGDEPRPRDLRAITHAAAEATAPDGVTDIAVDGLLDDAEAEARSARSALRTAAAIALLGGAAIVAASMQPASWITERAMIAFGVGIGLGSLGFVLVAERHRKAARATKMRARELSMLSSYESELTAFQKQVLRLVLAPRLFAGTADKPDPLTEPAWPTTAEVIEALHSVPGSCAGHPAEPESP